MVASVPCIHRAVFVVSDVQVIQVDNPTFDARKLVAGTPLARLAGAERDIERGAVTRREPYWTYIDGLDDRYPLPEGLFMHRAYIDALQLGFVRCIRLESGRSFLFQIDGNVAHCLGRLCRLTGEDVSEFSRKLFDEDAIQAVIFEDIETATTDIVPEYRTLSLSYQANWHMPLHPEGKYMSSKRLQNLRWRRRKLEKMVAPTELTQEFRPCRPGDVTKIVRLNRQKIQGHGRHHCMSEERQQILERVCSKVGYISCLYAGDDIVGGSIVGVAGDNAYGLVTGYNEKYRKFAPGFLATYNAIKELEVLGVSQMNFLWGDSAWKADFKTQRVPLNTLVVHRDHKAFLSARIWNKSAVFLTRSLKAFLKQYLPAK